MDEPITKVGFFHSNLFYFLTGQVITIISGLMLFAFTWGSISQEATENRRWRNYVDETLKRMDSQGTNASRYGIQTDTTRIELFDTRLKAVESDSRKIDVMAEKISRIDETVKELKLRSSK